MAKHLQHAPQPLLLPVSDRQSQVVSTTSSARQRGPSPQLWLAAASTPRCRVTDAAERQRIAAREGWSAVFEHAH